MKKLLYIASLPHSGSTLLDLMLGSHPRFIGLGEVARFLERDLENSRQAICSCGNNMDDCPFWSKVATRLESQTDADLAEKYEIVFDVFDAVYGDDHILVDSSKHLPPLEILHTRCQREITVLYLMRDVRSFTISRLDNLRRKANHEGRQALQRIPAYIFWQWYRRNKTMQRFFQVQNMQMFQLGYEELCLYPDQMMEIVYDFLGEERNPTMLTLQQSGSHVMRGNRMRYQKEKSKIRYDHRWFLRREWIWPALFFPNIMRYNASEVYHNNTEALWKQ